MSAFTEVTRKERVMAEDSNVKYLGGYGTVIFGAYLVALAVALGYGLVLLMKQMSDPPSELDLIFMVMIVGALGSYVHAATSFASYVGNQRMGKSWLWWYILRPFIGSSLALIFYFVVRGGFIQAGSGPASLSVFGMAALAGLTGMFSKQATDKLSELFDNLFRVGVHDDRSDKLTAAGAPPQESESAGGGSDA